MSIVELDQAITLWINGLGSPAMDSFWIFMSANKIWFPFYGAVMAFMIWKLGWKKGLIVVLSLFICVLLTDKISFWIKEGIQRFRPCYTPELIERGLRVPVPQVHYYGFFSGHAANTFGFAMCSWMGLRNDVPHKYTAYGIAVFLWAAVTSLSRIMLAAHFVGDILVGMLFGIAVGWAVASGARYLTKKV